MLATPANDPNTENYYDPAILGLPSSGTPHGSRRLGPLNPSRPYFLSSLELIRRAVALFNTPWCDVQNRWGKAFLAAVFFIPKLLMTLCAAACAAGLLVTVDLVAAVLHATLFSVYRSVAKARSTYNYFTNQNNEPHSGENRNPVFGSLGRPFREHSLPVEIHLDVKAALERFESLMGYTKNSLKDSSTLADLHNKYQALKEAQIACDRLHIACDRLHKGDPPKIKPGTSSEIYKETCEARDAARTAFNEAINNRLETREAYLNARTKVRTIQNKINELEATIKHNLQDIKKFTPIMEEAKTKIDRLHDEIDALEGNTASIAEAGDIELRPLLLNGALERTTASTAEAPATEPPVEDKNAETLQQQLDRKTNELASTIEKHKELLANLNKAINATAKNDDEMNALMAELMAAKTALEVTYASEEEDAGESATKIDEKDQAIEREIKNLRQVKGGLTNQDKNKAEDDGYAIWYGADNRPCVLVDPENGSPIKLNEDEIIEFNNLINKAAKEAGKTAPAAKIDKSSGSRIFGSGKSIYFQDAKKYDLGRYLLTQYKKMKGNNNLMPNDQKKAFQDKIKKVYFDKSPYAKCLLKDNPSMTLDTLYDTLTKQTATPPATPPAPP